MLDYFRKHSQSVMVWILVGAIAFIFIVQFGPQSRGCGQTRLGTDYVAKVYQSVVTPEAWRWAYTMHNGDQMQPKEAKAMRLRESVMDGLIERELLVHQARKLGLRVTEDEVDDALLENKLFLTSSVHAMGRASGSGVIPIDFTRDDGSFDFETFKMFITNRFHMTFVAFKEQQKNEMLAQNMRRMVEASVHVSEAEVRAEYEKSANRAKVGYVAFDPGFFIRRLDPTEEEIQTWIDENEDEVKKKYEDESYRYENVERQVRTSHILIKVQPDDDEDAREEKQALAQKVLEEAQGGADFAELARKYSDDTMSARAGGDIGFKSRGQLVEKYEDVAFGMKEGEIQGPVESEFGYHVIRCDGFREGDIPFEDVREEIGRTLMLMDMARTQAEKDAKDLLAKVQAGTNIMDAADQLEDLYYPAPAAADGEEAGEEPEVEPASDEPRDPMMPRYKESSWVQHGSESISGIGKDEELVEKVFDLDMESPLLPEVVNVGDRWYVLQLIDRKTSSDGDFATKKVDLERALLGEKKITVFTQWVDDLRDRAEQEGAIQVNEAYLKYNIVTEGEAAEEEVAD